jgi:hypothetical protein
MKYRLKMCDVNIKSNMDALLLNIPYKLNHPFSSNYNLQYRQEGQDRLSPLVATYTRRREAQAQAYKC